MSANDINSGLPYPKESANLPTNGSAARSLDDVASSDYVTASNGVSARESIPSNGSTPNVLAQISGVGSNKDNVFPASPLGSYRESLTVDIPPVTLHDKVSQTSANDLPSTKDSGNSPTNDSASRPFVDKVSDVTTSIVASNRESIHSAPGCAPDVPTQHPVIESTRDVYPSNAPPVTSSIGSPRESVAADLPPVHVKQSSKLSDTASNTSDADKRSGLQDLKEDVHVQTNDSASGAPDDKASDVNVTAPSFRSNRESVSANESVPDVHPQPPAIGSSKDVFPANVASSLGSPRESTIAQLPPAHGRPSTTIYDKVSNKIASVLPSPIKPVNQTANISANGPLDNQPSSVSVNESVQNIPTQPQGVGSTNKIPVKSSPSYNTGSQIENLPPVSSKHSSIGTNTKPSAPEEFVKSSSVGSTIRPFGNRENNNYVRESMLDRVSAERSAQHTHTQESAAGSTKDVLTEDVPVAQSPFESPRGSSTENLPPAYVRPSSTFQEKNSTMSDVGMGRRLPAGRESIHSGTTGTASGPIDNKASDVYVTPFSFISERTLANRSVEQSPTHAYEAGSTRELFTANEPTISSPLGSIKGSSDANLPPAYETPLATSPVKSSRDLTNAQTSRSSSPVESAKGSFHTHGPVLVREAGTPPYLTASSIRAKREAAVEFERRSVYADESFTPQGKRCSHQFPRMCTSNEGSVDFDYTANRSSSVVGTRGRPPKGSKSSKTTVSRSSVPKAQDPERQSTDDPPHGEKRRIPRIKCGNFVCKCPKPLPKACSTSKTPPPVPNNAIRLRRLKPSDFADDSPSIANKEEGRQLPTYIIDRNTIPLRPCELAEIKHPPRIKYTEEQTTYAVRNDKGIAGADCDPRKIKYTFLYYPNNTSLFDPMHRTTQASTISGWDDETYTYSDQSSDYYEDSVEEYYD